MADPSRRKDYASQVRKKLATSSRTGQACDRCKLRKIRCDADPNGCAGCRAAAEICETTDRITKKAHRRGLADHLESENQYLKARLQECQRKLAELGVQSPDARYANEGGGVGGGSARSASLQPDGMDAQGTMSFSPGIEESMWQKHMNNVSEFAQGAIDEGSPQTLGGFLYYSNRSNASMTREHITPPLPDTLQQAQEYATWYFRFLNPYMPIVDKRQVHQLLLDMYSTSGPEPQQKRSVAQEAIIHLIFTFMKFQMGQRNKLLHLIDEAMAHFKYAIGFTQDLLRSQTLQDVQATALIALQLRAFPRPGASYIFGQIALNFAVECGLHRSVESLPIMEKEAMEPVEIEIRKRLFWCLYGMVCGLSIRFGRPLPLRLCDIDIEIPAPVEDYLEGEETSLSDFQKCSYQVGIAIVRLMALQSELYNAFYSLSNPPPSDYARLVERFRHDLETWRKLKPPEISDSTQAESELTMYSMYLELYDAEFRFLLYHPLLHPPEQPVAYKDCVQECQAAISDSLQLMARISQAKSLDVPWHMTTLLLAMTFTQLFTEDQRSSDMTADDLEKLWNDMATWLTIFGRVGELLGSGPRLQTSVRKIVHHVLDKLKTIVDGKAGEGEAPATIQPVQQAPIASSAAYAISKDFAQAAGSGVATPKIGSDFSVQGCTPSFPEQAYSNSSAQPTYSAFDNNVARAMYPDAQITYDPAAAEAEAAAAAAAANFGAPSKDIASNYMHPEVIPYYSAQHDPITPANEWIRWSQANLNPFVGNALHPQHEYLASANTLMAMGNRSSNVASDTVRQDADGQWPINLYNLNHYGGNPPG